MVKSWPEKTIAEVHQLYVVEGRAPSEIARLMGNGMTRASVQSGASRRGWNRAPEPAPPMPLGGAAVLHMPLRDHGVVARRPKILADRERGECAFPVGPDPGEQWMSRQLFCCEPVAPAGAGKPCPYCPGHQRIVRGK